MNKKANIADGFENIVWLIAGTITLLVVALAVTNIGTKMSVQDGFDTPTLSPFWETVANTPVFFDWGVLLVTLILIGGSLILYYFVDIEPFMYVVSWILIIVLTIAIIIVGSALPAVLNAFPTIVSQMLFIPFLINNVHWVALIYFVLSLITLHIPK